jgi:hypothetical protein
MSLPESPLPLLWNRLAAVRSLRFQAVSRSATGWNGTGTGQVVSTAAEGSLVFQERGAWVPPAGRELIFTNTFRWSRHGDRLRLEHLRYGAGNPVFLFDLEHRHGTEWREAEPHQCADDRYSAVLRLEEDHIVLGWTIVGPRKDESIEYVYQ